MQVRMIRNTLWQAMKLPIGVEMTLPDDIGRALLIRGLAIDITPKVEPKKKKVIE
jgi:hypothetical protein